MSMPLGVGFLGVGLGPRGAWAEGDGKSEGPKATPPKMESPAPLTERERWLLDRVELLEKRVAELEINNNRPAASSAEIDASQPASAGAPTVVGAEDERSTTRGTATAA